MEQPFKVNFNSLHVGPNERRELERAGVLDDLCTSGATVAEDSPISFSGFVDWIEGNRLVLTGHVRARWTGDCRRCLIAAKGDIDAEVREIFEPEPTEGETYPLNGAVIDIEPMVREAVMLELPVAPLCREDCKGLCPQCGVNRNDTDCSCETDEIDVRWAGLEAFKKDAE